MFGRKNFVFLFQPLLAAFLVSLLFFVIIFAFFRIGYAVDDDISSIALVSGYLGGSPLPFLAHSNVLLGLLLAPLYGLGTDINWEIWFFIAINFTSVWALIYTLLSRLPAVHLKWFAVSVVLLCDVFFIINITYTMIAAFAGIAGFCLVITTAQSALPLKKGIFLSGVLLVVLASLIRFKALLLIAGLILPVLVFLFFYKLGQWKKQVLAFAVLGIVVLGGYFFDQFYLQASPEWYSFQVYDEVRSQLHDTPRKVNVQGDIVAGVGWSSNDSKDFFTNWFFPDRKLYSIENLQYLVEHIPDKQIGKTKLLQTLVVNLFSMVTWPYWLVIFSTGLTMLFYGLAKRAIYPLLALSGSFFALSFYLSWAMKYPDRILLSLLAGFAIFGIYILTWSGLSSVEPSFSLERGSTAKILYFAGLFVISVAAVGLALNWAVATTKTNIRQQAAYQDVLADLANMQASGAINKDALIISPAYGMPLNWANPLSINFPKIQVLEMGWLTFSPAYDRVLLEFDAQPLPEALYTNDNVYVMTPGSNLHGIVEFIKEHQDVSVDTLLIYQIPDTGIGLYKLQPKKVN